MNERHRYFMCKRFRGFTPKTRMKTINSKALSQFGAEKIAFPPKPDKQTEISNYRVASLLKFTDF